MSVVQKGGGQDGTEKKNQSFRARETEVQISPLKLITLMIWAKSFSIGSGILLPSTWVEVSGLSQLVEDATGN